MPRGADHDPYRGPPSRYGAAPRAYYEAAKPGDTYRRKRREPGSANTAVGRAGSTLRQLARHAEQNHDLARGVLAILVANIAGPRGIGIEPQPRRRDGSIHTELAEQIRRLLRDWAHRPEITWRLTWPMVQHLLVRSWMRDGEVFAHHLAGRVSELRHGTRVPLSLELLEADYLPLDLSDPGRRIVQGVQLDRWGKPSFYHLYKSHPGDIDTAYLATSAALRTVKADRISHLALVDRLHQMRGVSVFASVLERLEDLKDYEESERVAAKVAASMTAFIKKGTPDQYDDGAGVDENGNPEPRALSMRAGMIFDDLLPGEDVGTIDTNRPNPNLGIYRANQLRAVSAGTFVSYSSASRDYNGSYSSQRQELVEQHNVYGMLQEHFIGQLVQPVYERIVNMSMIAGLLSAGDIDAETLDDALYIPPQMPWIDPDRESRAFERLEENMHASGPEIIRRRGQNPRDVIEQQVWWEAERRRVRELRGDAADPAARSARNLATDTRAD